MPEDVTLNIDGISVRAAAGTTVLEAALAADIYIPNLCHHPDLKPVGACRLCMVEVAGRGMAASCVTSVSGSGAVAAATVVSASALAAAAVVSSFVAVGSLLQPVSRNAASSKLIEILFMVMSP